MANQIQIAGQLMGAAGSAYGTPVVFAVPTTAGLVINGANIAALATAFPGWYLVQCAALDVKIEVQLTSGVWTQIFAGAAGPPIATDYFYFDGVNFRFFNAAGPDNCTLVPLLGSS